MPPPKRSKIGRKKKRHRADEIPSASHKRQRVELEAHLDGPRSKTKADELHNLRRQLATRDSKIKRLTACTARLVQEKKKANKVCTHHPLLSLTNYISMPAI